MNTYTNPQFPGKTFRRLEVGEKIQKTDFCCETTNNQSSVWKGCASLAGLVVESYEGEMVDPLYYYREIFAEDPSALTLQRIEQKLDAVLAKLND